MTALASPPSALEGERELRTLLESAARRAAQRGTRVTAIHTLRLADPPAQFAAVLASAEREGELRFFAARADEEFELLGLGAARRAALHDAGALELAKATESWLEPSLRSAPEGCEARGPFIAAGLAFEPRPAAARERAWRPFASAAAALPELTLERRGARVYAHRVAVLHPTAAPERERQVERALARLRARTRHLAAGEAVRGRPVPRSADTARASAFRAALHETIAAVRAGRAHKVVIARRESLRTPERLDVAATLRALGSRQHSGLRFAWGIGRQTFLGCTPERLVRRAGLRIETGALAATASVGRTAGESENLGHALRASKKEREEHAWVVRGIEAALRPLCRALRIQDEPQQLATANLQHLHTRIAGELHSPAHVLSVVAALHPTAAVAGAPREAALDQIRRCEGFDRGAYAGPVGWFDARGEGDFFVALRCARVRGASAQLYAGVGLVEGSDPEREWAETELKLETMREALRTR